MEPDEIHDMVMFLNEELSAGTIYRRGWMNEFIEAPSVNDELCSVY